LGKEGNVFFGAPITTFSLDKAVEVTDIPHWVCLNVKEKLNLIRGKSYRFKKVGLGWHLPIDTPGWSSIIGAKRGGFKWKPYCAGV
jgi:hypothetical protein